MTTIHHFDVPSHPSGTSNPGEAADGIAAGRSGDKLRTAGITVYQAIHEFPPHGMVIRARGREQTTESITLTKAHKLFHRFHFIHCGQPSPPAFTLPQTPEKHKGGDLFETRQEADQKTEDPAGTSRARSGELAYRKAEAGRGAGHPPQAHEHHPGHPGTGPMHLNQEGAAE